MATPPLPEEEVARRLDAWERNGRNAVRAAAELGISRETLNGTLRRARPQATVKLEQHGYQIPTEERTPEEAWSGHVSVLERKIADTTRNLWAVVKRPRGPFVIFHSTDEHVDDDAAPLNVLADDVRLARSMNAVMAHGGDLLNNWAMAGRIAKEWAKQTCTLPDGLLRARYFIDLFEPDVWTDGNHEEMNPYLMQMLHGWLPKKTIVDYWTVRFIVRTPAGRDLRVVLSHKFEKGRTWFHPHQGAVREALQAEPADLYLEGHLHVAGSMHIELPERGEAALAASSAGYKIVDQYAARISHGGKVPKLRGRAHWIVCDPQAEFDEDLCKPFISGRQAEAYVNGLQNLRTV